MSQVSTFTVKLAGTIMLVFGIAGAILVVWIAARQFTHGGAGMPGFVIVVTVLAAVAVLCSVLGYRLLFNKPNTRGSALSPIAWLILALFFGLPGLAGVVFSLVHREYGALTGAACGVVLGYWCLLAARQRPAPIVSVTFPPETRLIDQGFAPAGFAHGIEILNDDHTPMEFVVSILRDKVGLNKVDSIRSMLAIHEKGGILLATSTAEEAGRLVDAITAAAREKNHPLVCRAVNLSSPARIE